MAAAATTVLISYTSVMAPPCCSKTLSCSLVVNTIISDFTVTKPSFCQYWGNLLYQKNERWGSWKIHSGSGLAVVKEEKSRFKWTDIGPTITEEQKQAISKLPPEMTKRCRALMKQIICFSPEKGSLGDLLAAWIRNTKPGRADWLVVLKELRLKEHPLYLKVNLFSFLSSNFQLLRMF